MPTIYLHQTCVASIIKHNYHFLCTDNFPRDDSIISCFFFSFNACDFSLDSLVHNRAGIV